MNRRTRTETMAVKKLTKQNAPPTWVVQYRSAGGRNQYLRFQTEPCKVIHFETDQEAELISGAINYVRNGERSPVGIPQLRALPIYSMTVSNAMASVEKLARGKNARRRWRRLWEAVLDHNIGGRLAIEAEAIAQEEAAYVD